MNLYDFAKIAANPGATLEELIENIDIGGPTMIRAAAKNWQDVAIVTSPDDYEEILAKLRAGGLSKEMHWAFAKKAFAVTAAYDRAITASLAEIPPTGDPLPATLDIRAPRRSRCATGKSPSIGGALSAGSVGIAGAEQLHGKELSYNNLVDLDAAWQLILEFDDPAAAVIKHTNPCGCAEGKSLAECYTRALEADPVSAYGGILAFNRALDAETAGDVAKLFVEAIAAPDYLPQALDILRREKNIRLLRIAPGGADGLVVKSISGGYLAQTPMSIASPAPSASSKADARRPKTNGWLSNSPGRFRNT